MSVTYSAAVPANPSQQLKAVLKMIEAGASFNMKEFSALTTDDYVHIWLPENVGLSKLSKDEFAGRIGMMGGLFTSFSVSESLVFSHSSCHLSAEIDAVFNLGRYQGNHRGTWGYGNLRACAFRQCGRICSVKLTHLGSGYRWA